MSYHAKYIKYKDKYITLKESLNTIIKNKISITNVLTDLDDQQIDNADDNLHILINDILTDVNDNNLLTTV